MKVKKRPYLIVNTVAQGQQGGSQALTREGIMLEIAMRLTINGKVPLTAWRIAAEFVKVMDKKVPFIEPPPPPQTNTNADRPIADVLK